MIPIRLYTITYQYRLGDIMNYIKDILGIEPKELDEFHLNTFFNIFKRKRR